MSVPPQKRLGIVVGAGSVKCAAAIGLFRVLQREGIRPDVVVGCSAGCFYATVLALGWDAKRAAELTAGLWTREVTSKPDRLSMLRLMFPRLFGFNERFGLKSDHLIMERLHAAFGDRTFADTTIPLFITATDFATGEQVVLHEGRLIDAMRASIAIPFAFRPWEIDGRLLIDGFLSDPLPIGVAIREGADIILAMGFESPHQTRITSGTRFAFQLSSIMTNNLLRMSFAFHGTAHHDEIIPIIPEFKERIRVFDTAKIPYIIEEGERAMEAQVPYIRRLLGIGPGGAR
jgi:NTE family protein